MCLALRRGALKMLALLYPDETAPLHDNDVSPACLHRLAADLPMYAERNNGAFLPRLPGAGRSLTKLLDFTFPRSP